MFLLVDLPDPLAVSIPSFATYGALMLWETLAPGRKLPSVRGWRLRGLAVFGRRLTRERE
jgi:hypothetical protein